MAKQEQKNLAFFYFTEEKLEAKEIAIKCKVRPNTVGDWIKNGNWKSIRDSKTNQSGERLDRIQQVIDDLAIERLEIMKQIKEYPEQIRELEKEAREVSNKNIQVELKTQIADLRDEVKDMKRQTVFIDQGIAMWNKTLSNFHTENKITLTKYIEIMEKIFSDLRKHDEKTYMKTLDFQHEHILQAALVYK